MSDSQKYRDLPFKDRAAYITALVSFTLGWVLVFLGLVVPPLGEISPTVLTAFGTALVYTAGVFGIFLYIKGGQSETYAKVLEIVEEKIASKIKEKEEKDAAADNIQPER